MNLTKKIFVPWKNFRSKIIRGHTGDEILEKVLNHRQMLIFNESIKNKTYREIGDELDSNEQNVKAIALRIVKKLNKYSTEEGVKKLFKEADDGTALRKKNEEPIKLEPFKDIFKAKVRAVQIISSLVDEQCDDYDKFVLMKVLSIVQDSSEHKFRIAHAENSIDSLSRIIYPWGFRCKIKKNFNNVKTIGDLAKYTRHDFQRVLGRNKTNVLSNILRECNLKFKEE
jgi:hypothetical protein